MNEHDRDLILGLADGSLSGDEATAARARIEADPELASELALQMSVRADLARVPNVALSDAERDSLRSGLSSQLHLEDAPPVAAPERATRRVPWWQPVLGVGVVAVFVTAVVVLPGSLGGSDDSADVASDALVETTVTATAEDGGDAAAGSDTPPPTIEVLSFADVDGSDLLDASRGAETPEEVTDSLERASDSGALPETTSRFGVDVTSVEACLERLGNELPEGDKTLAAVEDSSDGLLLFFAVNDSSGVETYLTVNLDQCRLVDVDE